MSRRLSWMLHVLGLMSVALPCVAACSPSPASPTPTSAAAGAKVAFPEKGKTITIIVPFAPGGANDIGARVLAPIMEEDLQTPVMVVNKAGASSQVGLTELAKSKPDGYTISSLSIPTSSAAYLDPDRGAAFARKDLQAVANLFIEDDVLSVNAESPIRTVQDFVNAAKAKPGQIKVGNSGLLAAGHQAILQFEQMAGLKLAHVQFDGSGPAVTALLGGHIDAICSGASNVATNVKAGKVRTIGIMGKKENSFLPGVSTFEAQGFKIDAPVAFGVVAPAGTPREIVNILSSSIKKATQTKEMQSKMEAYTVTVQYMDPDQFNAYWTELDEKAKAAISLGKLQK